MYFRVNRIAASLFSITLFCVAHPTNAATREEIDTARNNAKVWLYSQQSPRGDWEPIAAPILNGPAGKFDLSARQWGGTTAMVIAALLRSGQSWQDPHVASALAFLRKAKLEGVYALSLRANVSRLLVVPRESRQLAQDDCKLLLSETSGGFFPWYVGAVPPLAKEYQPLLSGLAVVAVADLEPYEIEVPVKFWQEVDRGWRAMQLPSGAWPAPAPTPERQAAQAPASDFGATAAAISVLIECAIGEAVTANGCHGNRNDPDVDRALSWLDSNMPAEFPAGHFEWLDPLQRAALACGRRQLNRINWFEQGAAWLLKNQNDNGSWGNNRFDTARALSFLSAEDAPLIVSKLEYQPAGAGAPSWNERPDDARNFGCWLGPKLCVERCDWQHVTFDTPQADLRRAPVLYISGNGDFNFAPPVLEKLREYVAGGGLIVGNADCASPTFTMSFRTLGQLLFPRYGFRELSPTHSIFIDEQFSAKKWKSKQTLLGMSNGVRELMLLFPDSDPGNLWETQRSQTHKEAFEVMSNVIHYSVGRKLFDHEDAPVRPPAGEIVPDRKIAVARLAWNGNWDPEPGGWPRLADAMLEDWKTELSIEPVRLGSGSLRRYRVAHFTGTGTVTLTDRERKDLTDFVASGGTLVIDAAGGDQDFADSMEKTLNQLFAVAAQSGLAKPLPAESDVFDSKSHAMEPVQYRREVRQRLGHRPKGPNLYGIEIDHRMAIFFSKEDLSAGLAGVRHDGICGYEPASATDLMSRLLIYGSILHVK